MRGHRTFQDTAAHTEPESLLADLARLDLNVRKRFLRVLTESRTREERLLGEIRRLRIELGRVADETPSASRSASGEQDPWHPHAGATRAPESSRPTSGRGLGPARAPGGGEADEVGRMCREEVRGMLMQSLRDSLRVLADAETTDRSEPASHGSGRADRSRSESVSLELAARLMDAYRTALADPQGSAHRRTAPWARAAERARADAAFVYARAAGTPAREASRLAAAAGQEERARQRRWLAARSSGETHPATHSRRVA